MARFAGSVDVASLRPTPFLSALAWGLVADTDLRVHTQHRGVFSYALGGFEQAVPQASVATDGPWTAIFSGYLVDRPLLEPPAAALLATRADPDAVVRLNGVFSGALWNATDRQLVLLTDRFAVRPLYWTQRGNEITFGSTVRAVGAGQTYKLTLGPESLEETLHIGWTLPPRTLWNEIKRVGPGQIVTWRPGRAPTSKTYWAPTSGDRTSGTQRYLDGAAEHLTAAMQELAARAEAPILTLSGGYDSRRLACELVRAGAAPRAFTTTVPYGADPTFDVDIGIAKAVAERLQIEHTAAPLPHPDRMPFQHRRTESLVGFETGDHVWATALLEVLPTGATNFDGIGGDRLLGDFYYEFDADRAARMTPLAIAREIVPGEVCSALAPEVGGQLSSTVPDRVAAHIGAFAPDCNRVAYFLMQARMSRSIAMFSAGVLGSKVEAVYPYLDHRVIDFVLDHDPALRIGQDLQQVALQRLYPEQLGIPTTHEPLSSLPPSYRRELGSWYARQEARVFTSAARRALATPALLELVSPRTRKILLSTAWGAGLPLIGPWLRSRAWVVPRLGRIAAALRAVARWRRHFQSAPAPSVRVRVE